MDRVTEGDPAPEIVVALVRPVGTGVDRWRSQLESCLTGYGYTSRHIKLSELLTEDASSNGRAISAHPEDVRVHELMTYGDELCTRMQEASAVALLGVAEIRRQRELGEGAVQRSRVAYIIDSLKRPAEVTQLREIYGEHLIVLGVQLPDADRSDALKSRLTGQYPELGPAEVGRQVDRLMDRDLDEGGGEYGQNLRQTFPMADAFIAVDSNATPNQIERIFDLLFGNPKYNPPSAAELGMMLANIASTRTAELGRKVGAAILAGRSVLGTGANEHPTPTGTPPYDASQLDITKLVLDTVQRLGDRFEEAERTQLRDDPAAYVSGLLAGPLKSASIRHLTEFQPTVHAEMNAILDALRLGNNMAGATAYVTAYPCHNCAKHIVALGLRVVYLEPYPKSRAASMYGASVEATFQPFNGIAPRRFQQLFSVTEDRKRPDGTIRAWGPREKSSAIPRLSEPRTIAVLRDRETTALSRLAPSPNAQETQHSNRPDEQNRVRHA